MSSVTIPGPLAFLLARQRLADYLELTKPRVTALVLLTVAAGFWLGWQWGEPLSQLWPLLGGTLLAVGGANALNQWMERVPDGLMRRTQSRPLPAGRLHPHDARRFGAGLALGGVLWLAVAVNGAAALLTVLAITSYVFVYTPLKRRTTLCTLVGAVPGALPPLIGWVGARNALSVEAWALFAILFCWQLPHFLAIGALYREDYARAGFRMLSVLDRDGVATARQTVLYAVALMPVSLLPALVGFAGPRYFWSVLLLGVVFLVVSVQAALARSRPAMRRLFQASLLYVPLLLAALVWGRMAGAAPLGGMPPLPASIGLAPSFSLVDQAGRPFTQEDLAGRVWIADFIYTTCPGQCLLMSDRLAALQRAFPDDDGIRFVSFSVDPERDTPQALAAYAARYGADPRWLLATGSRQALRALSRDGFHLAVSEDARNAQEPITHSKRLVLVDRQGALRGFYEASDVTQMARLRRDAKHLLEERP